MTMRALSKLSIKTTLITPDLSDGFSILALINLDENEDLVSFSGVIFSFGHFTRMNSGIFMISETTKMV